MKCGTEMILTLIDFSLNLAAKKRLHHDFRNVQNHGASQLFIGLQFFLDSTKNQSKSIEKKVILIAINVNKSMINENK